MNTILLFIFCVSMCIADDLHLERFESLSAKYKPGASIDRIVNGHSNEATHQTYVHQSLYSANNILNQDLFKGKGYFWQLDITYIIPEQASEIVFDDCGNLIHFTDGFARPLAVGAYPDWGYNVRVLIDRQDRPYVLSFALTENESSLLKESIQRELIHGSNVGMCSENQADFFHMIVNLIGIVRKGNDFGLTYIPVNYSHSVFEYLTSSVAWAFGITREISTEDDGMVLSALVAYMAQILYQSGHQCSIDTIVAYLDRCGVEIKDGDIKYDLIEKYLLISR